MNLYQVGQPYSPTRSSWPEQVEYNYRSGQHELRMFFKTPSAREVDAVRHGSCEFAFLRSEDVIVFLYRFGEAIPWSDNPFSIHLVPAGERIVPNPTEVADPHDLMSIVLVDAATGVIRVLRVVTFSTAFTTALRLAIGDQAVRPWPGDTEYERQVRALYARYPTSIAMATNANARTVGGR